MISKTIAVNWGCLLLNFFDIPYIRTDLVALLDDKSDKLTLENFVIFEKKINLLRLGMPITKVLGKKYFWDSCFKVNNYVMDPRYDSETIIETALNLFPSTYPKKILDLGVGSGCLLLSLLKIWKKSLGIGIDISKNALNTAKNNASILKLNHRCLLLISDWFSQLNVEDKFDLIIVNPPYISYKEMSKIDKNVVNFDPYISLFSDEDGLGDFRRILAKARNYLMPDGFLLLEIGASQRQSLVTLSEKFGWQIKNIFYDMGKNPRCLVLV